MADDGEQLGIYYKCLHGANAHFALTEPHSFVVEDAVGRSWICYPVRRQAVEDLDLLDDLTQIETADGMIGGGAETEVRLVFCEDEGELGDKLAEQPSP